MHAVSADHVIHTCYCYGSFSYVFKLINLTRFILELVTEFTLQVSENSTLSIQIYFITVFVKKGNAECVQSKPYRALTRTSLTGDQIRAENGLEMFENYTRQS